jgi:hypothetical protein
MKYLRNHPPTGIAINTATIDVKVTADIFRAALLEMSHLLNLPIVLASC